MAAFRVSRPMEDFFINPTVYSVKNRQDLAMPDSNTLYNTSMHRSSARETLHKVPSLKAPPTITDLRHEANLWKSYTSDEESASPIDDKDDMSLGSMSNHSSDSLASIASDILEEVLGAGTPSEQQCVEAQAVRIQMAGKPRVILVPKIELPSRRATVATERPRRPSAPPHQRSSSLQQTYYSTRSSEDSQKESSSSTDQSPASTAPSSIHEYQPPQLKHKRSFRRHVPLMEAVAQYSPSPLASSPQFPIKHWNTTPIETSDLPPSPRSSFRPSIKKMSRFSSTLSLTKGSKAPKPLRTNFTDMDFWPSNEISEPMSATAVLQPPIRSSSLKPRLVARGAGERAPSITLPPFPGEAM